MTVGELIKLLRTADASSRVLFLGEYADSDEADEVCEVDLSLSRAMSERMHDDMVAG
jgi:hypothetical protein